MRVGKTGEPGIAAAVVDLAMDKQWSGARAWREHMALTQNEVAHRMGLVQRLAPAAEVLEAAIAEAEIIAKQAPLGVQAALRLSRIARTKGDVAGLAAMLPELVPVMQTEDSREAVKAFGERRPPVFVGR